MGQHWNARHSSSNGNGNGVLQLVPVVIPMRKVLLMAGLLAGTSTTIAAKSPTGADNFFKSDKVTMERVTAFFRTNLM